MQVRTGKSAQSDIVSRRGDYQKKAGGANDHGRFKTEETTDATGYLTTKLENERDYR